MERLIDRDYLLSPEHQEQLWLWNTEPVSEVVKDFAHHFVRVAARHGIPVFCAGIRDWHITMLHAQYADLLGPDDWVIFGQLGLEASELTNIDVNWLRDRGQPGVWLIDSDAAARREKT